LFIRAGRGRGRAYRSRPSATAMEKLCKMSRQWEKMKKRERVRAMEGLDG
jgi:hypothetical protein